MGRSSLRIIFGVLVVGGNLIIVISYFLVRREGIRDTVFDRLVFYL